MRFGYAVALAAFFAAAPAVAQLTVTNGNDESARHEYNANQDRAAGRQNMEAAHQEAAMGNYRSAARDQQAAHEDWHAAHHQQYDSNHDANSGVTLHIGQ
jgi:hypothetical protein